MKFLISVWEEYKNNFHQQNEHLNQKIINKFFINYNLLEYLITIDC